MRLLFAVLLALWAGQAAADTRETFDGWVLRCIGPRDLAHCTVSKTLSRSEADWLTVEADPAYDFVLTFIVPHRPDLKPTLSVGYGPTRRSKELPLRNCTQATCIAKWYPTTAEISATLQGLLAVVYGTKSAGSYYELGTKGLADALGSLMQLKK